MSIIHFINFPLTYNTVLPSSMNYRVKTQQFKYIYILMKLEELLFKLKNLHPENKPVPSKFELLQELASISSLLKPNFLGCAL